MRDMIKPGNYEWIPDAMRERDAFIIGGGPSLNRFRFERVRNMTTVALYDAVRYVPDVDIMVAQDGVTFSRLRPEKLSCRIVAGVRAGIHPHNGVTVVGYADDDVSDDPSRLYSFYQSGFFAINLCLIARAERIFLLGLDQCFLNRARAMTMAEYVEANPGYYDNYARRYFAGVAEGLNDRNTCHFYSTAFGKYGLPDDSCESKYSHAAHRYSMFGGYDNIYYLSPISLISAFKKISITEAMK